MRKGEITKQRIVELAAPLFNEHGYAGCSMADIMSATGLEKGGIYRYFESKETLALAALEFAIEQTRAARLQGMEQQPTQLGKLRHVIGNFRSPVRGGCPYLNAAVDGDDGNPAIRRLAKEAFEVWRRELVGIVKLAVVNGELRPDVQPPLVADTIMASLEGALVLSRVQGDRNPLRHAQVMLNSLLDSLTVQQAV